jgi:hypothetical protein
MDTCTDRVYGFADRSLSQHRRVSSFNFSDLGRNYTLHGGKNEDKMEGNMDKYEVDQSRITWKK